MPDNVCRCCGSDAPFPVDYCEWCRGAFPGSASTCDHVTTASHDWRCPTCGQDVAMHPEGGCPNAPAA